MIQVPDVDRCLRARARLFQRELKVPRIGLFDADDVRVEDDIERRGESEPREHAQQRAVRVRDDDESEASRAQRRQRRRDILGHGFP